MTFTKREKRCLFLTLFGVVVVSNLLVVAVVTYFSITQHQSFQEKNALLAGGDCVNRLETQTRFRTNNVKQRYKSTTTLNNSGNVPGVIILGMHRSGTSLLSGLLVKGFNYTCPGKLLQANSKNPLGFFENENVVSQNDIWLQEQGLTWDRLYMRSSTKTFGGVFGGYDPNYSCTDKDTCREEKPTHYYKNLDWALKSLEDRPSSSWILKDPRLCLTLPTWLGVLGNPAIVFTFRDPLEVAKSLQAPHAMTLVDGIKLWIWYNRMAIQNSMPTCRVITSKSALARNPVSEVTRIGKELERNCGLPTRVVNRTGILNFFQKDLIHGGSPFLGKNSSCEMSRYQSTSTNPMERRTEAEILLKANKVYCDMQRGTAFLDNYTWPVLT